MLLCVALVLVMSCTLGGANVLNMYEIGGAGTSLNNQAGQVGNAKIEKTGTTGQAIGDKTALENWLGSGTAAYLTKDIEWNLGSSTSTSKNMGANGVLDGNGHTITITVNNTGWNGARSGAHGIFVHQNYGTIKNVKFVFKGSMSINSGAAWPWSSSYDVWLGLVVGSNDGTLENVTAELQGDYKLHNNNSGRWVQIGGLVGSNQNYITNCTFIMNSDNGLEVNSKNSSPQGRIGGIIGENNTGANGKVNGVTYKQIKGRLMPQGSDAAAAICNNNHATINGAMVDGTPSFSGSSNVNYYADSNLNYKLATNSAQVGQNATLKMGTYSGYTCNTSGDLVYNFVGSGTGIKLRVTHRKIVEDSNYYITKVDGTSVSNTTKYWDFSLNGRSGYFGYLEVGTEAINIKDYATLNEFLTNSGIKKGTIIADEIVVPRNSSSQASNWTLKSNQTLEGNGKTIKIDGYYTGWQNGNESGKNMMFGMFLRENQGIVQNLNINYTATVYVANNNRGSYAPTEVYAGIVCAKNTKQIKNVNVTITGEFRSHATEGHSTIGGITGLNESDATIENCTVTMNSTAEWPLDVGVNHNDTSNDKFYLNAAGVVGENKGNVYNVTYKTQQGKISSRSNTSLQPKNIMNTVAGICAYNNGGTLSTMFVDGQPNLICVNNASSGSKHTATFYFSGVKSNQWDKVGGEDMFVINGASVVHNTEANRIGYKNGQHMMNNGDLTYKLVKNGTDKYIIISPTNLAERQYIARVDGVDVSEGRLTSYVWRYNGWTSKSFAHMEYTKTTPPTGTLINI